MRPWLVVAQREIAHRERDEELMRRADPATRARHRWISATIYLVLLLVSFIWFETLAFYLLAFGYYGFVAISRDLGWLGWLRRPLHGALLCALILPLLWRQGEPRAVLVYAGVACFLVGFFLEKFIGRVMPSPPTQT